MDIEVYWVLFCLLSYYNLHEFPISFSIRNVYIVNNQCNNFVKLGEEER